MHAVAFVLIYSLLQTVAGQFSSNINESFIESQRDTVSFVGKELYIHLCNFTIDESTKLDAPVSLVKYNYDCFNLSNPINLFNPPKYNKFGSTGLYTSIAGGFGTDKLYSYKYRFDEVQENDAGLYACAYKLNTYNEDKLIKKIYHLELSNLIVKEGC